MTTDDAPIEHVTIDGEQACILGCTTTGQHARDCLCTNTCPNHPNHCTGCAPRPTPARSLLCKSCFHRRLRKPLRRTPALYDWLTSRKAGLKAATYNNDHITTTKDTPLPFNADIVDHLAITTLLLNAWANHTAQQAPPGPGPKTWDAIGSAAYLEAHAGWIAEQSWVSTLVEHLTELEHRSRVLAPWQPVRHQLPLPCMKCDQLTLVLFGGDDWVTCTNQACDEIIGWSRYKSLSRAIGRIYENEQKGIA